MTTPILRHYQREACESTEFSWAEHKRVVGKIGTGGGKTVVAAELIGRANGDRIAFLADSRELVEQPLRVIRHFAGIVPALDQAQHEASLSARVVVASSQTWQNPKRLERWPKNHFQKIIIDECFTAGTLVDGRAIETLSIGETITAFNESTGELLPCEITWIFKRKPQSMVSIKAGGKSVNCTAWHPFWTKRGWVPSLRLTPMDELAIIGHDMRNLPFGIYSKLPQGMEDTDIGREGNVQQGVLRSGETDNVLSGIRGMRFLSETIHANQGAAASVESIAKACVLKSVSECEFGSLAQNSQSNAQRGRKSEGFIVASAEWNEASNSGRKRKTDSIATDGISESARMGFRGSSGDQDAEGFGLSNLLQTRHGESGNQDRSGSGRRVSQFDGQEGTRQKEGCFLEWARVESVEVHESTSDGRFGGVCPDGFVYNLEVAGLHTYTANGFVVHNCHRGTIRDMAIIDNRFPDAQVLGLSATPYRSQMRDLSKWFSDVPFSLGMLDLCEMGFAPPIQAVSLPIEIDLDKVGTSRIGGEKDYKLDDLDTTILPYFQSIAESIKEYAQTRFIICFLPLIKSSIEFVAVLRSYGIKARHVDGKSKDRAEIVESFSRGEFNVLCNADVMSTGVDIPIADCILDLSPTCSLSRYQQRVGRITRVLPGVVDDLPEEHQSAERRARIAASAKKNALILDIILQNDRLKSAHAGHLIARDEEEANAIYEKMKTERTPEELQELARRVQEEKENRLVAAIDEAAARKHAYDPAQIGYLLGDPHLADYDGVKAWQIAKPSDKQLGLLQRFGVDISAVEFKGLASDLIGKLIFRSQHKFATLKQVALLRKYNIPEADKVTSFEAARIIKGLAKK